MRRATFTRGRYAAAIVFAVASASTLAMGNQEAPAGVFTTEQAAAGRTAYDRSCGSCHMPDLSGSNDVPPLSGAVFMSTWRSRTTKDLLDYMSASMPPGGSSLRADAYASIAAYILEKNGASAGTEPLGATTSVLLDTLIAE